MENGSTLLPAFWVHFVFALTGRGNKDKKVLLVAYLISFFIWILNLVDYFFYPGIFAKELINKLEFNYYPTAGIGYKIFFLYFFGVVLYSLYILFLSFKNATSKSSANQFKYMMLACVLGLGGGGMTFLPTFDLLIRPYGVILFAFYPIPIAYAILKYKLMDIRAIVARAIAFGSIVILLVSIFSIFVTLLALFTTQVLGTSLSQTSSTLIVGVILSFFVVFGYKPLVGVVERATNEFLFQKSYNPDEVISTISDISSSITDLQQLLKGISKVLNDTFKFEKIGFAFITSKGDFQISYKDGFKSGVAEQLAAYPNAVDIFVKELKQSKGLLVIDEMVTSYQNGEFKPVDPKFLDAIHQNDIAVIIPLRSKQDLIGVAVLGSKKSGDQYSVRDITTLELISGQIAIAIENAKLYDELKYFNIKLEEEVKQKTAELRSANNQLKRLDQAKSDFISIASHQLRTPLTVIKGYISMIQEGSFGKVPAKIGDNLSKVFISNERLINLVEDLLNISRIESGRQQFDWKEVNLVELANTLTENLKQNAQAKGLKLQFRKPHTQVPIIIAEHNKIQDVMINFIDNAIKYTAKGHIDVSVEAEPKGMVTFSVKDTGRGIDSVTKDALFKKFSRGQGSFQINAGGTGLGLYVARMIVEAHEGKIWADSEGKDKGTAFCFAIPIAGPKRKEPLPFSQDGQTVEQPVASAAPSLPATPPKPVAVKKK